NRRFGTGPAFDHDIGEDRSDRHRRGVDGFGSRVAERHVQLLRPERQAARGPVDRQHLDVVAEVTGEPALPLDAQALRRAVPGAVAAERLIEEALWVRAWTGAVVVAGAERAHAPHDLLPAEAVALGGAVDPDHRLVGVVAELRRVADRV